MPEPPSELRPLAYPKHLADPKQWLHFVQMKPFEKAWENIGLDDDALRALELCIMVDPQAPPVIAHTGGLRKLRFSPKDWKTGKSGALRVCYVYFEKFGLIVLLYVYTKTKQSTLTQKEKGRIRELILEIEHFLERRNSRE